MRHPSVEVGIIKIDVCEAPKFGVMSSCAQRFAMRLGERLQTYEGVLKTDRIDLHPRPIHTERAPRYSVAMQCDVVIKTCREA